MKELLRKDKYLQESTSILENLKGIMLALPYRNLDNVLPMRDSTLWLKLFLMLKGNRLSSELKLQKNR